MPGAINNTLNEVGGNGISVAHLSWTLTGRGRIIIANTNAVVLAVCQVPLSNLHNVHVLTHLM